MPSSISFCCSFVCPSDWGLYLIVLAALFFSFRILGAWVLTEKAKVFF